MRTFARTCVAVLAAGASRRFGSPKLLAPFSDATLLDRALDAALGCAADCAVVVTGAYHNEMLPRLAKRSACFGRSGNASVGASPAIVEVEGNVPFVVARNRKWESGQASSVRAAVRFARAQGCTALLVMVADQPRVTAAHLNALLWEYDQGRAQAYLSANDHGHGNPCLFDQSLFDDLLALEGDEGARALFRSRRDIVARHVHFDDPYLFEDVDTRDDLARALRGASAEPSIYGGRAHGDGLRSQKVVLRG